MPRPRSRRSNTEAGPKGERAGSLGQDLTRVRVVTRGLGLILFATAVAIVYLAESPSRDGEAAASCDGLNGYVRALAVHPDGGTVSACNSDGSLTLWEPGSGCSGT